MFWVIREWVYCSLPEWPTEQIQIVLSRNSVFPGYMYNWILYNYLLALITLPHSLSCNLLWSKFGNITQRLVLYQTIFCTMCNMLMVTLITHLPVVIYRCGHARYEPRARCMPARSCRRPTWRRGEERPWLSMRNRSLRRSTADLWYDFSMLLIISFTYYITSVFTHFYLGYFCIDMCCPVALGAEQISIRLSIDHVHPSMRLLYYKRITQTKNEANWRQALTMHWSASHYERQRLSSLGPSSSFTRQSRCEPNARVVVASASFTRSAPFILLLRRWAWPTPTRPRTPCAWCWPSWTEGTSASTSTR